MKREDFFYIKKAFFAVFFALFAFSVLSAEEEKQAPTYGVTDYRTGIRTVTVIYERTSSDKKDSDKKDSDKKDEENTDSKEEKELTPEEKKALEEIKQAEQKAKEAETASVLIVQVLLQKQKERDECLESIKVLEKYLADKSIPGSKTIESQKYLIQDVLDKKVKELKEMDKNYLDYQIQINEAADNCTYAYWQLASLYEKYNVTGDPVELKSGTFMCEYDEILGKRKYRRYYGESFGLDWTCPLDSRIIRCQGDYTDFLIEPYKELLAIYQDAYNQASEYHEKYSEYSLIGPIVDDFKEVISNLEYGIKEYEQLRGKYDKTKQLNAYATYGRYSSESSYYNPWSVIIYQDFYGNSYRCYYDDGCWEPYGKGLLGRSFTIYGRQTEVDGVTLSENNDGGFLVCWENGTQIYYNKYGILEKIVDRNNNQTYFYSSGSYVYGIRLPTGENLSVERNPYNYITKVSGPVSGTTEYFYNEVLLTEVRNPDGISVYYTYDEDAYLTAIGKADGKSVQIEYAAPDDDYYYYQKQVCKITNENGESEYFDYNRKDPFHQIITHTDYDGIREEYICNNYGNVVSYKNSKGDESQIVYADTGYISEIVENGIKKKFVYKRYIYPAGIEFEDGSSYEVDYSGSFVKSEKDRDGFTYEYDYDDHGNMTGKSICGNKISVMSYYSNGLLKELEEKGIRYEYFYNQFNSLVKKKTACSEFSLEENWTYDANNRLVKYENTDGESISYSYSNNKKEMTEIISSVSGKKRVHHKYNARGWEEETEETDLITGINYTKRMVYDGCGNITKVLLDGMPFADYEYSPGGNLKSYTIWNLAAASSRYGWKTEVNRNSQNQVTSETVYEVNADNIPVSSKRSKNICEYNEEGAYGRGAFSVLKRNGSKAPDKFIFDVNNRLISERFANGSYNDYSYSKAGRILSVCSSGERKKEYIYSSDGSYIIEISDGNIAAGNGVKTQYFYNQDGILQEKKKGKISFQYLYDKHGNLICEKECKNGTEVETYYGYDRYNNLKSVEVCGRNNELCYYAEIIHDYSANKASYFENNRCVKVEEYDAWQRVKRLDDCTGTTLFDYDCLGNVISERNLNGITKEYTYTPYGDVQTVSIKSSAGKFIRKYEYEPCGKLKAIYDNGNKIAEYYTDEEGNYVGQTDNAGHFFRTNYDEKGIIQSVQSSVNGITKYFVDRSLHQLQLFDSVGNFYQYGFDKAGNCVQVKRGDGKEKQFWYDEYSRVLKRKDFSGKITEYIYDDKNGKVEKRQGSSMTQIQRNSVGRVIAAKNDQVSYKYEYDCAGRLIKAGEEQTRVYVQYEYDDFGRCVRKFNDLFDYRLSYDGLGRLARVKEEKSGVWVSCDYDFCSREILRKYSSGMQVQTDYDEYGRKQAVVTRNSLGQIIKGDFILYDDKNRISVVYDETGNFTKYEYDSQGRLITSYIPYNQQLEKFALQEGLDCGLYIENYTSAKKSYSLSSQQVQSASILFEKAGIHTLPSTSEYAWKEEYTYNSVGSLVSVKNPVYEICYVYNSLNQVVQKKGQNTQSEGKSYRWDDNGNLIEITGQYEKITFEYGVENRPAHIVVANLRDNSTSEYFYTYDAFGRRFSERTSSGVNHVFLYDNLLNNLICDIPVFDNNVPVTDYAVTNESSTEELVEELMFKFVDKNVNPDITYNDSDVAISDLLTNEYKNNYDGRPFSTLFIGGSAAANIYVDNSKSSGYESSGFVKDFRNNITGISNDYSDLNCVSEYDTWGNVIYNEQNIGFQFSMNSCLLPFPFFNLGYRDYLPQIKTFVSSDPVESGMNWYAYSCCDPVNYADYQGYKQVSLTAAENAKRSSDICQFTSYCNFNGHTMGLPAAFDCADTAGDIDGRTKYNWDMENNLKTKEIYELDMKGNYKDAKKLISTRSFYQEHEYRKVLDGYDNDIYMAKEKEIKVDQEKYDENKQLKDAFFNQIKNPDNLDIGSVVVFKSSENKYDRKYNDASHVITVTARQFDSSGNVIGFSYIEGHINKETNIGYVDLQDHKTLKSLESFLGTVDGIYEIEKNDATGCTK